MITRSSPPRESYMVALPQVTGCSVCGTTGGDKWNQDSFGAFKVVVDANKNRKVARDGSRFLYDDAVDSIIRMLWPDRVADYAQVDVDREREPPCPSCISHDHKAFELMPSRS
jgi:hypothetical protein